MSGETSLLTSTDAGPSSLELDDGTLGWVETSGSGVHRVVLGAQLVLPVGPALALVLERFPRTDEVSVGHLIRAANVRLELTTTPTVTQLEELRHRLGDPVDVLRPRSGSVALHDEAGAVLTTPVDASGDAHLIGTVDERSARGIVAALLGSSSWTLHTELEVINAPESVAFEANGHWLDLHTMLGAAETEVAGSTFRDAVDRLVAGGLVAVSGTPDRPSAQLAVAVADELWAQRFMIGHDSTNGLVLESAPHPEDVFRLRSTRVVGDRCVLRGAAPFFEVLAPITSRSLDDLVDLLVIGRDGPEPVPARRRQARRRDVRHRPVTVGKGTALSPMSVLASGPVHVAVHAGLLGAVAVADAVQPDPGPLVADAGGDSWPDAHRSNETWSAPTLRLRTDDGDVPLFELHHEGITAEGDAALRAVVTVPFELAPAAGAKTVAATDVTVHLAVPFRDSGNGNAASTHLLPGVVEPTAGGFTARFEALNQWSRLAYLALSDPDASPAELVVGYSFRGYQRVPVVDPPTLVYGAQLAAPALPLSALVYDVKTRTVPLGAAGNLSLRPQGKGAIRPGVLAGTFQLSAKTEPKLRPAQFNRTASIVVARPCADMPDSYVERIGDGTGVIGCRPALRLGESAYVHFLELRDLAASSYRVYRSQIEAGHYLVVPSAYQLGRRLGDGPGAPHRPLVVVHAAVGTDADDVSVLFEAGLQPAIRPLDLARLRRALLAQDERARIVWPTEVSGVRSNFGWAAVGAVASGLETTAMADGTIRFGAAVDVADWLVLRSVLSSGGMTGTATFTFRDGSSVSSSMAVDLRRIAGPWGAGPIQIERAGASVTVTNRTESAQFVHQLVALGPGDRVEGLAVEQTVPADGSTALRWSPAAEAELHVDYEVVATAPVDVDEIRSFVEEVDVSVVFVNQLADATEATVRARIQGTAQVQTLVLGSGTPAVEVTFLLPLTDVIARPTVEYRVSVGDTAGEWRGQSLHDSRARARHGPDRAVKEVMHDHSNEERR